MPVGDGGSSRFARVAADVAALVEEKNAAYGDSFARSGDFLRLLFPTGIKPEQYGDMLAFVRIFDKFKRIATDPSYGGEDPRRDILGYAILNAVRGSE